MLALLEGLKPPWKAASVFAVGVLSLSAHAAVGDGEADRYQRVGGGASDVGDTLVIGYWADPARLSRIGPASHLVFEPLFRGSYTTPGEVTAALVTKWEPADDYRTWTYYMRPDVRWHDGTPLTAHDVQFSEELRQHPAVGTPGTRQVRVVDDTTFEITYLVPTNPTPWRDVWPKHLLEHLDPEEFWEWDFWAAPVGSGPYRYVRHVEGESVEWKANPDYYSGPPAIDRVVFRYDEDWGFLDSVPDGIDALGAPAIVGPDFLSRNPDYRVYSWDQPVTGTALSWNLRREVFRDASVRAALTMAIDRQELARLRGFPETAYARDVLAPQYPSGISRGQPTPFDPSRARQLLAEAGWIDIDGDGVRERGGEEFTFTLMVSEAIEDLEIARRVTRHLAGVGVGVGIEPVPRARLAGDAFREGKVDAAMFRVSLASIARLFGEDSPIGFDDPELIRHWSAVNGTWNPEERRQHLHAVMTRFRELLPVTVLLSDVQSSVAHRRVMGLRSPDRGDVVEFLSDLRIAEDEEGREPSQPRGRLGGGDSP